MLDEAVCDEEVVHMVRAGDVDAFGTLVHRYEPKMKRYARKFLSSQEDIEDLVQEVFIKAYTNLQSFDVNLRFSPWIYRIAHNTFVNELKKKSRFSFSVFEPDVLLPQLASVETADASALAYETKQEMEKNLGQLKIKSREVLILHYFEDLSYREISDVLQIPVTTVGVRIMRAREQLKQLINTTHE